MTERRRLHAILISMTCSGLVLAFCAAFAGSAGSLAVAAPRNAPKCTIDIAEGKQSDCALLKANHEWILWSNSAAKVRSVHFKASENPFMEKSCWDVDAGARARSGPVALNAAAKTYVAFLSDAPCAANPADVGGHGTIKVSVQ
jgi:hypothetical protein